MRGPDLKIGQFARSGAEFSIPSSLARSGLGRETGVSCCVTFDYNIRQRASPSAGAVFHPFRTRPPPSKGQPTPHRLNF
ncbi:hypothetical protein DdX_08969 [Ditylenchus destructor]|uniref:Uncharacterized protein n=1 Tax=Ditylenchus destructor TaxID=166010 RepID=A0AAD4N0E0_9BILA|nr:hypothetical protein DdX_08969 [Ditylenchus destructor]